MRRLNSGVATPQVSYTRQASPVDSAEAYDDHDHGKAAGFGGAEEEGHVTFLLELSNEAEDSASAADRTSKGLRRAAFNLPL